MFRALLISMFLTSAAFADTWIVDDDGKADFDNIQAAVDAASDGDEIVVMPGRYTSTQDGHVVNMLGKAVTLRSSDPSDPDVVAATIIDGEGGRRGIACFNGETNKTVIEGLTITNGLSVGFDYNGDGDIQWWEDGGGGMLNYKSSPTLTTCTFTNNTADLGGGMSNNWKSSPTLTTCTFTNNTADLGGGMYTTTWGSSTLTDCTFTDNTANHGGGIACISDILTLTDTTVCGNTPDQIYGYWTDGGGSCIAYSCEDNNGDGIPDKCTNPGGNTILVPEEYATIQDAINVAVHGDEIIIGPGTYTGVGDWVVNPMGKRLWIHSSDGPEVTIIDGEGARRGIQCTGGETSETIFEGLTITNGDALQGGGMYTRRDSSPTLTNCTFTGNTAVYDGGGMYNYWSSPTLTNCTFTGNTAVYDGGGMANWTSSPTLTNCTFTGNTAVYDGGGMHNHTSNPTMTDCTFEGNSAAEHGGGMSNTISSPTLIDCTFTSNSASGGYGGGMCNDTSSPTLTTCTFDSNSAAAGGGMANYESNPMLENCTFTANSAEFSGGGMNNDSSNPTLTDTTVCGNTPDQIYGDWTDNGGNTIADVCPADCPADVNENGVVDVTDILALVGAWGSSGPLGDINDDGTVNVVDLIMMLKSWGPCE